MLNFPMKRSDRHALTVALVAIVVLLLKTVWILSTSVRALGTTTWILDDAFIEINVARMIALGHGFSFDGLHPTSGSPLLWTYLLSIPHYFMNFDRAVQWDFVLSAIFGALSAVIVFFLARRVTGRTPIAWTAFLLALLSGNAFLNGMNAMDTAFFTFAGLLAFALSFDVGRPKSCPAWAWGALTGLAAGAALMTRADGLFLLIPLVSVHVINLAQAFRRAEWRDELEQMIGIMVVAALCVSVYIGWHLVHTGAPFPANQAGRRELALALHGVTFQTISLPLYLKIVIWNTFQLAHLIDIAMGSVLLGILALLTGAILPMTRRFSLMSALYMGTFFAALILYQWYFPDLHGLRYINLSVHLLFILVAALLWNLPLSRLRGVGSASMVACILLFTWYLHYQMSSRFPWAKFMSYVGRPTAEDLDRSWRVIDWMRTHVPPGAAIGVRDHGKVALFSGHPIQDLAGNIDPVVPVHVREHTLAPYLHSRAVEYIFIPAGRNDLLYQEIHRSLVLAPTAGYPSFEEGILYKIDWTRSHP